MRTLLLSSMLVVLFLAVEVAAMECPPYGLSDEQFAFSSDDSAGGTSYLGVDTRDVTSDRLEALHLKEEAGVEVTMVDQDAPAGKAGLKEQDVIMSINGDKVESVEQLRRLIHEIPPGRTITVGVSRNGQPLSLKAQLGRRNETFSFGPSAKDLQALKVQVDQLRSKDIRIQIPPMPDLADMDIPVQVVVVHSALRSGLMVENLTPQLGDFFGVKSGHGILIRSVEKGSRGEKAGFHAGDVIVKVNDESINDSSDFSHALRSRKDNTVKVGIVRDKKQQMLTLALPAREQSLFFDEESLQLPQLGAEMSRLRMELAKQQLRLATVRRRLDWRCWL
jgi:serine protease Do